MLEQFRGQPSPELFMLKPITREVFYDEELFSEILKQWTRRYVDIKKAEWKTTALFRSLEMAYRASSLPLWNDANIHDYGTSLALWVSAFEILAHPENGHVGPKKVVDLLGKAHFESEELNSKKYGVWLGVKEKEKKERVPATLIQRTYFEIYNARNSFLHGNPVNPEDLYPDKRKENRPLTVYAPILYKCALMAFLGLFDTQKTELSPFQRWAQEEALSTVRTPSSVDQSENKESC